MTSQSPKALPADAADLLEAQSRISSSLKNAEFALTANNTKSLSTALGETANVMAALSSYILLSGSSVKGAAVASQTAKVVRGITAHVQAQRGRGDSEGSSPMGASLSLPEPSGNSTTLEDVLDTTSVPLYPVGTSREESAMLVAHLRDELSQLTSERDALQQVIGELKAANTLVPSAPSEERRASTESAVSTSEADWQNLHKELREEQIKASALLDSVRESEELIRSQAAHIKTITMSMRSLQTEHDSQAELLARKNAEIKALQESMLTSPPVAASAAQTPGLTNRPPPYGYVDKDDFDALQTQNQLLQDALREHIQRTTTNNVPLAAHTLQELETDHQMHLEAFKTTIKEQYDRENDLLKERTALKDEITELQRKVESFGDRTWLKEERRKHLDTVEDLQQLIQLLQDRCQRAEHQLEISAHQHSVDTEEILSPEAQQSFTSDAKLQEADTKYTALQDAHTQLQAEHVSLATSSADAINAHTPIPCEMNDLLSHLKTADAEIQKYQQQIHALQEENQLLEKHLSSLCTTLAKTEEEVTDAAATATRTLEKERVEQRQIVEDLRGQLVAQEERLAAVEGSAGDREAVALKQSAELRAVLEAERAQQQEVLARLEGQLHDERTRADAAHHVCEERAADVAKLTEEIRAAERAAEERDACAQEQVTSLQRFIENERAQTTAAAAASQRHLDAECSRADAAEAAAASATRALEKERVEQRQIVEDLSGLLDAAVAANEILEEGASDVATFANCNREGTLHYDCLSEWTVGTGALESTVPKEVSDLEMAAGTQQIPTLVDEQAKNSVAATNDEHQPAVEEQCKLIALQKVLVDAERQLEWQRCRAEELVRTVADSSASLATLSLELEVSRAECMKLAAKLADEKRAAQEEVENVRKTLVEVHGKYEGEVTRLASQLSTVMAAAMAAQSATVQHDTNAQEAQLDILTQSLVDERTAREAIVTSLQETKKLLAERDATVVDLTEQLKSEELRMDELLKENGTRALQEAAAREQVDRLQVTLKERRSSYEATVTQLTEELQEAQSDFSEKIRSLSQSKSLSSTSPSRSLRTQPIEWLREEVKQRDAKIGALETEVIRLSQERDGARQSSRNSAQQLDATKKRLSELQDNLNGEEDARQAILNEKERMTVQLHDVVAAYEKALGALATKTEKMESVAVLQHRLEEARQERDTLQRQLRAERIEKEMLLTAAAREAGAGGRKAPLGQGESPPDRVPLLTEVPATTEDMLASLRRQWAPLSSESVATARQQRERSRSLEVPHRDPPTAPPAVRYTTPPVPRANSSAAHKTADSPIKPTLSELVEALQEEQFPLFEALQAYSQRMNIVDDATELVHASVLELLQCMSTAWRETELAIKELDSAERRLTKSVLLQRVLARKLRSVVFGASSPGVEVLDLAAADVILLRACSQMYDGVRNNGTEQKYTPGPRPAPAPVPTPTRRRSVFVRTPIRPAMAVAPPREDGRFNAAQNGLSVAERRGVRISPRWR